VRPTIVDAYLLFGFQRRQAAPSMSTLVREEPTFFVCLLYPLGVRHWLQAAANAHLPRQPALSFPAVSLA
jgi:hypothetical protein